MCFKCIPKFEKCFAAYWNHLYTQTMRVHAKSLQSCPTLWYPMNSSLPGFSVPGILQARILEWVAMPFSRESSQPRDWTRCSLHWQVDSLPLAPPGKPLRSSSALKISVCGDVQAKLISKPLFSWRIIALQNFVVFYLLLIYTVGSCYSCSVKSTWILN